MKLVSLRPNAKRVWYGWDRRKLLNTNLSQGTPTRSSQI
jgi:hypothetical protein